MVIKICKAEIKAKNFIKFSKPNIYLGVMLLKKNKGKFTITRILENDTFISMRIHKMSGFLAYRYCEKIVRMSEILLYVSILNYRNILAV
jgi:hypothetical protein